MISRKGISRKGYGRGTWVDQEYPFGLYIRAYVLCSDGKKRQTCRLASTADTFFSVPAAVKVEGKTVSGYITFDCMKEDNGKRSCPKPVVKFIRSSSGVNASLLPEGAYEEEGDGK